MNDQKLDCRIVQDLLPLYHDDVVHSVTREAVADHLAQCPACRAEYQALCADLPIPPAAEIGSTGGKYTAMVRRRRRKHLLLAALAAVLVIALALVFWPRPLHRLYPEAMEQPGGEWLLIVTSLEEDQRYAVDQPHLCQALEDALQEGRASLRWFDADRMIKGPVEGYLLFRDGSHEEVYFTEEGVLFTEHFRWQLTDGSLQRLMTALDTIRAEQSPLKAPGA